MPERERERGRGRQRVCVNVCCAIYKFSDKLADNSNNKETTKPKRQTIQQRRVGEKGKKSAEGQRETERERGRKREEATGSQLDNFILQGSQKMCTEGSRVGWRGEGTCNCQGVCNT